MQTVKKKKVNSSQYSIGYHFGGNKNMKTPWEVGEKRSRYILNEERVWAPTVRRG